MKVTAQGFTLIELMITVAIIGILSTIALPAYQDYLVRSRVTELVVAIGGAKTAITEYALAENTLTDSGSNVTIPVTGKLTAGTAVSADGTITVAGSTAPTSVGAVVSLVFTPLLQSGQVTWRCRTGNQNEWRYVPAECRN